MQSKPDAYKVYLTLEAGASLIFSMIFAASMVYQVNTVGLNPLQLVLVGTTLEFTAFVCEVPTGVVADAISRRLSIIIGYVIMGLGFVVEGTLPYFEAILVAQVIWGLGYTFTSGATQAWIVDEIGEDRAGHAFMRGAQANQLGSLAGFVAGALLGSVQINLPIVLGGVLVSLVGVALIAVMPEHGFKPKPREDRNSWQHMGHILRDGIGMVGRRPALGTILLIGLVFGVWSEGYDRLWTAHLLQDFSLPEIGHFQPVVWTSAIRVATLLLSAALVEGVRRRIDTTHHQAVARALFIASVLLAAGVLGVALAGDFALAALLLIAAGVVRQVIGPLYDAWVNQRLDSSVRATVNSLASQANALGQVAGGPAVGFVGLQWGVRAALVASAAILAPVLWLIRHTSENHEG